MSWLDTCARCDKHRADCCCSEGYACVVEDIGNAARIEADKRWPYQNIESAACRGAFVYGAIWQSEQQKKQLKPEQ